tara:strand:+ start:9166 stop:9414 length:249 start_codon:yes stop_codon:yes gene_type:complete
MEETVKRYGFVIDGELFHILGIPESQGLEKLHAGMQSFPMVIDISDRPEVQGAGWKFSDNEFYNDNPVTDSADDGPGYELDD